MCGVKTGMKIIPFRGEYYGLRPERRYLAKNLIYPVPDPAFPLLGVHFTGTVDGEIEAGPNAVLGLACESYEKLKVSPEDLREILGYQPFWRLARNHWRVGLSKTSCSLSRRGSAPSLQKLVPEVRERDLVRMPAGVRPQTLVEGDTLVDDFEIFEGEGSVHVWNAPSPAATDCLPTGQTIADRVCGEREDVGHPCFRARTDANRNWRVRFAKLVRRRCGWRSKAPGGCERPGLHSNTVRTLL